jgi:uncharacterized membrane protein
MTTDAASFRGGLLLRVLLAAATFALVHVLTLYGAIPLAVAVLVCAMFAGPMASALRRAGRRRLIWLAAGAGVLLTCTIAVEWPEAGAQAMLVVPPFLGCLMASAFFAHSLMPGEDPIITRLCRISRGEALPDGLAEYSRLLTWGWTLLPALLGFAGLAAFAAGGLEAWSWATNVVSPSLLAAYFVGEHIYRGFRHPHLGRPSILRTFNVMLSSASWRR